MSVISPTDIADSSPNLEALQSQAELSPTVRAGELNVAMTVSRGNSHENELRAGGIIDWPLPGSNATLSKRAPFNYDVVDDSVVLKNSTELTYKIPANTTLIQVLGPVGKYNQSFDGSRCFAALDPHPPWWRNFSFPLSASYKLLNQTNRTMFLLPVDPAVDTTVIVGPVGNVSSCWVSGISSYPFH